MDNKNYDKIKEEARQDPAHAKLMEAEEEKTLKLQRRGVIKAIESYFSKEDLAEQLMTMQPLYYDDSKVWWAWDWNNFRWKLIDETDILNFVSTHSTANTVMSKERNEIIESLKQLSRKQAPLPVKKSWVQFKDTIVDIETGEEKTASSRYFVTNPIPWALDKNRFVETPVMDRIFEEWVGKDNVKLLYEILAYSLLPDYPIHRLFCFIGSGMNGKSCYLNLLRNFIGENNVCSSELDTLLVSRFEVTRLHKKLVCMMGETNFGEMSKTSIIKKLTGQDVIGFEYKNKNPFEDVNYAKILIATNNLPTTTDKTIGFYRRWTIIDFPNQFSEQKDILTEIPIEEYESLAVKCLGILKDILTERKFTNEGSLEERMEKYESKSDFLRKFVQEFTEESFEDFITVADFKKKFNDWCKENRHRELADTTLSKNLKKLGFEPERKHFDWMFDGKGGQARIWTGIKWK